MPLLAAALVAGPVGWPCTGRRSGRMAGVGKTHFARALSERLRLPCVELDALHWGPNWQPRLPQAFEHALAQATSGPAWVADDNDTSFRHVAWPRATHVIWLDHGRPRVFSQVLLRTLRRVFTRQALWHGNVERFGKAFLSKDSILLWSLSTFGKNRLKYERLQHDPALAHLTWVRIRSRAEAARFLSTQTDGARQPWSQAGPLTSNRRP